uniref:Reverse transcriptase RNase H-like domain-containing protein n=1 Tax=Trichogramma kaykai TaxID=54128 RepID=A0ABD2XAL0_9HYME
MTFLGHENVEFHVISQDIPIPCEGILGSAFFRQSEAIFDFGKKTIQLSGLEIPLRTRQSISLKPQSDIEDFEQLLHEVVSDRELLMLKHSANIKPIHIPTDTEDYLRIFNVTDMDLNTRTTMLQEKVDTSHLRGEELQRFIKDFAKIAKPLTTLLQKDTDFIWSENCDTAFQTLKNALCNAPLLIYPDFSKPFIITTDASGYAIGGILSQGEPKNEHPVAYTSRMLRGPELNYDTYEKEALAIVHAVEQFRPYIYGHPFIIYTDHQPLVWFKTAELNTRIQKWRFKLAEYQYDIRYKVGKSNCAADALSRNPVEINIVTRAQQKKLDKPTPTPEQTNSAGISSRDQEPLEKLSLDHEHRPMPRPRKQISNKEDIPTPAPRRSTRSKPWLDAPKISPAPKDKLQSNRPNLVETDNKSSDESDEEVEDTSVIKRPQDGLKPPHEDVPVAPPSKPTTPPPQEQLSDDSDTSDAESEEEGDHTAGKAQIVTCKDAIESRKNILIYFSDTHGKPLDQGGIKLLDKNMIPPELTVPVGQVRKTIKSPSKKRQIYALGLREATPQSEAINIKNLILCLQSLRTELESTKISEFSIAKTNTVDNIEWGKVLKALHDVFSMHPLLISLLILLPYANGMIGYDCEAKSLNVTTMSLLDIDECQPPKEELKIEKQYVQLLQVNNFESVKVTQCKVEIQRNIYYCGKLDHLFAVDHGTAEYVHEVTKQACEGAHNSGVYYHGLHTIGGLKVNQTTSHSLSLAGSAAHNGVCTRGNYADPYGTWENVVVLGMLRITLQEQMAKVDLNNGNIHFRSGTTCNFASESCIDSEGGNSFWKTLPTDICNFHRYSVLYEGQAEKITDEGEEDARRVYAVTSQDITFGLTARKVESVCGYSVITTEHPRLFIFETVRGESFAKRSHIDASNLDLFSYMNSKFVYVERHIKYQIKNLYRDIVSERCRIERQTLKNSLAIASNSPDQFAYNFMKGPGYMALNAGEVIHILKCIPVEVRLQHGEHCYAELQVSRGNSTYFLTPKTHILKKKGTQVGCNMILPPYYLIDDVWYKILPKPTEAKDPITIRPESRPTWNYISPKYLATSGIYTEKDLDDLSRALMFPLERPALLNGFARELHGATITTKDGTIIRLMNDDVIDKLVETTWGRLWSKFMSFGSASAGVIAILMILHIVKLAVDVILNGVALHRAYGWSMHMFAACLGSLTHLLVNAGRYNEAPNQEDATEMIPINEQPTPAAPIATTSHELSYQTEALLQRAERAREFGAELGREADELRRELERATRDCSHEDRSLCAVIDPSGLHLGLRLDRVARDDRLLRLRSMGRDNLTEAGRQARGEYLYVPHHVARTTLDARNRKYIARIVAL